MPQGIDVRFLGRETAMNILKKLSVDWAVLLLPSLLPVSYDPHFSSRLWAFKTYL